MSPRALLGIGFAAGLIIALVCGQAHVLPLWSLLLVATGCMGAARPRGAMPMAVVVEIGVVIGFILRVMAFAQFVGDPGNLWPVVLLFSVLYSAPVVLAGAITGAVVRWWQDRIVQRNAYCKPM